MPDFDLIPDTLRRLREAHPTRVYASGDGRYALNPPLPEADAARFERDHGIRLPADYRRFLTEFGDGGAWRTWLFPLGCHMVWRQVEPWRAEELGVLSEPFPHTGPWNLAGEPVEDAMARDEYDAAREEWEARYYGRHIMNGAIPLASLGCAMSDWLVVAGPEAGHVWRDYRAYRGGVVPLAGGGGPRVGFAEWYLSWLDEEMAAVDGRPPSMERPRYVPPAGPREPSLFDGFE